VEIKKMNEHYLGHIDAHRAEEQEGASDASLTKKRRRHEQNVDHRSIRIAPSRIARLMWASFWWSCSHCKRQLFGGGSRGHGNNTTDKHCKNCDHHHLPTIDDEQWEKLFVLKARAKVIIEDGTAQAHLFFKQLSHFKLLFPLL